MQVKGELRRYIEYRPGILHTFPQGWDMVFRARVIIIQTQVCHETSAKEAGAPSVVCGRPDWK
jgi:hypothetical protein